MPHIAKSRSFRWSVVLVVISVLAYTATYRYYAMEWLILAFANLLVGLCFLMVFAWSIMFWILNRSEYQKPFVPFCINILTLVILWTLPAVDHSKYFPKGTCNLTEQLGPKNGAGLYTQRYLIFGGGAGTTDVNAVYLTDLKNFRIYLGAFDEYYDSVNIKREGDRITIIKQTVDETNMQARSWKSKWMKVYSLKKLIATHTFD